MKTLVLKSDDTERKIKLIIGKHQSSSYSCGRGGLGLGGWPPGAEVWVGQTPQISRFLPQLLICFQIEVVSYHKLFGAFQKRGYACFVNKMLLTMDAARLAYM